MKAMKKGNDMSTAALCCCIAVEVEEMEKMEKKRLNGGC